MGLSQRVKLVVGWGILELQSVVLVAAVSGIVDDVHAKGRMFDFVKGYSRNYE
ncbi:uncharacterized protein BO66DRAFT_392040 [Aspergillus aculeatinus CBS 121060]|uniref:Uncharacterized protein n=1 Tax=Aspergillus aculeatinus CBS 121060 TaxID=1448322 RepID=A0ACD1H8V0_9EURO|nr:hypothetical protein BO66DRAFT_392040 [Aspergillus aculeatinus CBS 121060]RAH70236.1 hypothetical protein BO66DRAFT_392040 [Aspergillus aculeatinus CBS 121060]